LTFRATLEIADLLPINAFMHDLGCHEEDPDPEEAYDRYREWLPFTHRYRTFHEGLARDLSYELEVGPGS
jgi:hypothetical protein